MQARLASGLRPWGLIWGLAALSAPAFAATIHVPQNAPTLQAAVLAAADGDSIQLADGAYVEWGISTTKSLTIRGNPTSPESVVLDADAQPTLLEVSQVDGAFILEGVTFRRTTAVDDLEAGLIIRGVRDVTLRHCVFAENRLAIVLASYDTVAPDIDCKILDCLFRNNERGIYAGGRVQALFERCVFDANVEPIAFFSGSTTIRNCTFVNNGAPLSEFRGWGVIASTYVATFVVESCIFASNLTYLFTFDMDEIPPAPYFTLRCNLIYENPPPPPPDIGVWPPDCEDCLEADPCFCDAASGNYELSAASPALGYGSCAQLIGALGVGCPETECGSVRTPSISWGELRSRFIQD